MVVEAALVVVVVVPAGPSGVLVAVCWHISLHWRLAQGSVAAAEDDAPLLNPTSLGLSSWKGYLFCVQRHHHAALSTRVDHAAPGCAQRRRSEECNGR